MCTKTLLSQLEGDYEKLLDYTNNADFGEVCKGGVKKIAITSRWNAEKIEHFMDLRTKIRLLRIIQKEVR